MSTRYPIPNGESTVELYFKNSRFIGRAAYTPSVAEARAFIERVKAEYPNNSHTVYAFAVGHGATVTHGMSDAGEPSGTAGRPALAVVRGSNLGDVTVAIVRYFGGTKLGTGGLVKAYTETAQAALAALDVTEKVERVTVLVAIGYPHYEQLRRLVEIHHGTVEDEKFATDVTLTLNFVIDELPAFEADLAELTNGQVSVVK
ncbi:MAG: YigZ family protein, partial [Chloroflexi bacterium]